MAVTRRVAVTRELERAVEDRLCDHPPTESQQPRLVVRQPARAALAPRVEPVLTRRRVVGEDRPPRAADAAVAGGRPVEELLADESEELLPRAVALARLEAVRAVETREQLRAAGGGGGDVGLGGGSGGGGGGRLLARQLILERAELVLEIANLVDGAAAAAAADGHRDRVGVGVGEGGALPLRQRVPERRAARDVDAHAAVAARGAAVGVEEQRLGRAVEERAQRRPRQPEVGARRVPLAELRAEGGGRLDADGAAERDREQREQPPQRLARERALRRRRRTSGAVRRPQRRAQPQQALARRAARPERRAGGDRALERSVGVVRRRRVGAVRRLVQQQPEQPRRERVVRRRHLRVGELLLDGGDERRPQRVDGRHHRARPALGLRVGERRRPRVEPGLRRERHVGKVLAQRGGPAARRRLQRAQRADRRRRADGRGARAAHVELRAGELRSRRLSFALPLGSVSAVCWAFTMTCHSCELALAATGWVEPGQPARPTHS